MNVLLYTWVGFKIMNSTKFRRHPYPLWAFGFLIYGFYQQYQFECLPLIQFTQWTLYFFMFNPRNNYNYEDLYKNERLFIYLMQYLLYFGAILSYVAHLTLFYDIFLVLNDPFKPLRKRQNIYISIYLFFSIAIITYFLISAFIFNIHVSISGLMRLPVYLSFYLLCLILSILIFSRLLTRGTSKEIKILVFK